MKILFVPKLFLACALLLPATSQAAIVINATESLIDGQTQVLISTLEGGSLSLGGATFVATDTPPSQVVAVQNSILLGASNQARDIYSVSAISGPFFSSNLQFKLASGSSGPRVGFNLSGDRLFVPSGYVSGTPISATSTVWLGHTNSSLGLIPGNYFYTFPNGSGGTDSITLNIRSVPEPASAALCLAGLGLLAFRRRRDC